MFEGDQGGSRHSIFGGSYIDRAVTLAHPGRRVDIPDWTPSPALSCLANPPRAPLRRYDLEAKLLAAQSPGPQGQPRRDIATITPEQRAQAQAVVKAKAAARRAPPGAKVHVDRRQTGAERIREYLTRAPEGDAYSAEDIARVVGVHKTNVSSELSKGVEARRYEIRVYCTRKGRHGQYRRVQEAPWPPLPPGAWEAGGAA